MTYEEFAEFSKRIFLNCLCVLEEKGKGYSKKDGDRLEHFYEAAAKLNISAGEALMGMKVKHTVCIDDIVRKVAFGEPVKRHTVDEKFTDEINYLILLRALIEEEGIFQAESEE